MTKVHTPTRPDPAHVAYWATKGWKHTGLGLFRNKDGDRGRLHVHADGSTSIRVLNFCAIQDLPKRA